MSATQQKINKNIKAFSITGLVHTLITVVSFAFSLVDVIRQEWTFYWTIRFLSFAQLINSIIWIVCASLLINRAKQLNNPKSVSNTRVILLMSILFVLTPDIIMVLLFWLPGLKEYILINIINFISPVLVFIGWFVGNLMCRRIKKAQNMKIKKELR